MFTGILLAVVAGGIWTLGGVMNSCCAGFKLDIVTYLFANVLFSMLITGLLFVRFDALLTAETWRLAAVMIPAGILNTGGALALQKALQKGHHGIVFLIAQSALVVPFLAGILFFGETTTPVRCGGVALIFFGMIFCAMPKIRKNQASGHAGDLGWLFFSLGAFALFGIAQSLMSLPSYWPDCSDPAGARTTLIYLGSSLLMASIIFLPTSRRSFRPDLRLILCGLAVAVLNSFSMRLLFAALDRLSQNGMASIGFSLAIGSSLIGFTLYSLLVIREKCYRSTVAGLSAIIGGGFLIAL